jgi:hypothetical protein
MNGSASSASSIISSACDVYRSVPPRMHWTDVVLRSSPSPRRGWSVVAVVASEGSVLVGHRGEMQRVDRCSTTGGMGAGSGDPSRAGTWFTSPGRIMRSVASTSVHESGELHVRGRLPMWRPNEEPREAGFHTLQRALLGGRLCQIPRERGRPPREGRSPRVEHGFPALEGSFIGSREGCSRAR